MTLPQPTQDMGRLRPEGQCKPRLGQKMIDGIIELTDIISNNITENRQSQILQERIKMAEGYYKGYSLFEPFNDPRQKVLQAVLAHLLGNIPETKAMKELRAAIHISTGSKEERKRILKYFADNGLTRQDLRRLNRVRHITRNLIQNGGSLTLLKKTNHSVPVPH